MLAQSEHVIIWNIACRQLEIRPRQLVEHRRIELVAFADTLGNHPKLARIQHLGLNLNTSTLAIVQHHPLIATR